MHLVVRLGSWSNLREWFKACMTQESLTDNSILKFSALGGDTAVEEEYVYEPVGNRRKPSKVPPPLYRRPEL